MLTGLKYTSLILHGYRVIINILSISVQCRNFVTMSWVPMHSLLYVVAIIYIHLHTLESPSNSFIIFAFNHHNRFFFNLRENNLLYLHRYLPFLLIFLHSWRNLPVSFWHYFLFTSRFYIWFSEVWLWCVYAWFYLYLSYLKFTELLEFFNKFGTCLAIVSSICCPILFSLLRIAMTFMLNH